MSSDSASKKCPNCNSYVDRQDKFCKVCGHDFSTDKIKQGGNKTFEDFLLEASMGSNKDIFRRDIFNDEVDQEDFEDDEREDTNLSEDYFADQKSQDENIYYESEEKTYYEDQNLDTDQEDKPLTDSRKEEENHEDDPAQSLRADTYDDSGSFSDTDRLSLFDIEKAERDSFASPRTSFYSRAREGFSENILENDSRFFRVLIILIVLVLIATGVVVAVNYDYGSPNSASEGNSILRDQDEDLVNSVIEAVNAKSADNLINLLKSSDQTKTFTKEDATKFIERLNSNPKEKEEFEKWIKEDLDKLDRDKEYKSNRPIRLENEGKNMVALIDPIKVEIENPENAQISLEGGKDYSFSGKETALISSNDLSFKQEVEFSYFDGNNKLSWSDIDLSKSVADYEVKEGEKPYEVRNGSDDIEAYVFVNDQNTTLRPDQFNEIGNVNINYGDSVRLVAKGESGLLKSEAFEVGEEYWVRLHIYTE
ncbi:MAG: hypothetical protein SPI59_06220 [Finegoldia sp.]|nr:hypothetical protein [Finegoldia sp.]